MTFVCLTILIRLGGNKDDRFMLLKKQLSGSLYVKSSPCDTKPASHTHILTTKNTHIADSAATYPTFAETVSYTMRVYTNTIYKRYTPLHDPQGNTNRYVKKKIRNDIMTWLIWLISAGPLCGATVTTMTDGVEYGSWTRAYPTLVRLRPRRRGFIATHCYH